MADKQIEIQARFGCEVWDLGTVKLPPTPDGVLPAGWELAVADGLRAIDREMGEQVMEDMTGQPRTDLGHPFGCACPGCEP